MFKLALLIGLESEDGRREPGRRTDTLSENSTGTRHRGDHLTFNLKAKCTQHRIATAQALQQAQ
jgi:hypothetical protein